MYTSFEHSVWYSMSNTLFLIVYPLRALFVTRNTDRTISRLAPYFAVGYGQSISPALLSIPNFVYDDNDSLLNKTPSRSGSSTVEHPENVWLALATIKFPRIALLGPHISPQVGWLFALILCLPCSH